MKSLLKLSAVLLLCLVGSFQVSLAESYKLSSHILDISSGKPASGVVVVLEKQAVGGVWQEAERSKTNDNGRLDFIANVGQPMGDIEGVYRLRFEIHEYFARSTIDSFYPYIEVVFEIKDGTQHFHVPITLSPFGYSTYRGS